MTAPVKLALQGLPSGVASPEATLTPEQSEFALPLRLAYGTPMGVIPVQVVATAQLDPERPKLIATATSSDIQVDIVPGEKPPGDPPLLIFEDQPAFVEQLSKGGGTVQLVAEDVHFGAGCLKVTPDQRYNEAIAGLGVQIKENPGPGEYRYLRFAWKKQGGSTICLQLNHDGAWGPGGSGKPGAKFRYHSGGEQECFGASIRLDNKIPDEYVVVTRDLFADFGEFKLTGLALSPVDGEFALFDHMYLAKAPGDWELIATAAATEAK